jgi:gliding motility-associated-like protein
MVRCLAIFLILLSTRLFGQCSGFAATPTVGLDCLTNKATVTVVVSAGTPPFTYSWSPNVSTTSVAVNLNGGTYNIIVTDANNCVTVTQAIINLTSLMNITFNLNPTNTISCFGANNGAITATVSGSAITPPFTYTWSNGSNSNGITNLSPGIYTLTAKDNAGCTTTNTYNVLEPGDIYTKFSNSVTCYGTSVNALLTTTGGIAPFSYTVNGNAVSGNTVIGATAGIFTIITKDANGCVKTNTAMLNQPAAPVFNFNVTQPTCPTSSNGGISVNISNMYSPYNYTWAAPTNTNASLSNIPKGIYTLTVKDASNCISTKTVNVVPISDIQTTFNIKPETCSAVDAAVTVNVTGGIAPLNFSISPFPSQSSNTFSNLATGMHTVIVTDANTCSLVSTFSIGNTSNVQLSIVSFSDILCYNNCDGKITVNVANAVAPVTYSLTNLPTYTTSNISNICAGTYTLKAIDNIGCYAITTVTFTNPAPYSYTVTGTSLICVSNTAGLNASANGGTAPYTYSWTPGNLTTPSVNVSPGATTVFSLNVFDSKGCTLNPQTFTVTVRAPITVSVSPQNSGICPGTTAQITPSVSGGDGNYTYNWQPGNFSTPSIFLSNLTNPSYSFYVSDGCGSPTALKVINLQIFPVTTPSFSVDLNSGCQPLCVQFKNTTPNSSNHVWNFGDVPFEQNIQNPFYCYARSGNWNVKLTLDDLNGCKVTTTFSNYINVLPQPRPNFASKPKVLTDDVGQGELYSTTVNGTSYKWFVDGTYQGGNASIGLNFSDTTCFVIKLVADNTNGCRDSLERLICVKPGFTFYMPNAFTPNGDGLNDVLIPFGRSWLAENYKFKVFNRIGHLIYSTTNISSGWDGKIKGALGENDHYFWRVSVTDYYGEQHDFEGQVELLK